MTRQWLSLARPLASVALPWILLGCGVESPEQRPAQMELETEEVGLAPDAELSTELDERAKALGPAIAGVLPSDFPADLPLFAPSSLIDFGGTPDGRRYVELDTTSSCGEVARRLSSELAAAGWRRTSSAQAGGGVYRKAQRQAVIRWLDRLPGCGIRVEY